ncbi:DUF4158 domain-containing protein [Actinomadura sp. NPDC048955]|uniref:DUF4158 domain-containing protein n=1 Tax=Actinomadura sp. NPDC048955 TaxID=3158228 RepID=UPI0033D5FF7B
MTAFRAGEVARTLVEEIPVVWVEPEPRPSRAPLALWLPHLTSTKEGHLPVLRQLAEAGLVAVSFDPWLHGDRGPESPEQIAERVMGAVEAAHESDRTLWRHRDFVRTRIGVKYTPAEVRAVAEAAIRTAVQSKDDPADLINVALDELVRQRCELPG